MKYRQMTEADLQLVVEKYIEYYNTVEECCWTYEKAYKRIHQVLTMEGSMCMVQTDEDDNITGYLMGYYKEYDDIRGYYLEEIVIFMGNQGKGYGSDFLKELKKVVRENGVSIIELSSVNDDAHNKF
jgi:L-amino acid N-acyltransferase YncA